MGLEDDTGKFSEAMLMSESGGGSTSGMVNTNKSPPGFKISYPTALILFFGAVALAVIVGVAVHFLHPRSQQGVCMIDNVTWSNDEEWKYDQCVELSEKIGKCLNRGAHFADENATNTTAAHQERPPDESEDQITINYRLPNTLVPIHYNIQLQPNIYVDDPSDFSLDGLSEMIIECAIPTAVIVIHLRDLFIKTVEIESEVPRIFIVNKTEDKQTQFLNLSLSRRLRTGEKVKLGITYNGTLEPRNTGLYYRSYKENNKTRYMVASVLAPTNARRVFPCMDEPHLKATFNVTLLYKHPMVALSNMPNFSIDDREDGWILESYTRTPLMSTYLLAFVIAQYDYINDTTVGGLHPKYMRYWTTPTAVSAGHLDYARSIDGHLFDYYEEYFNESYILPKQDSVVVPDHKGGAMENWGLVTYRPSRLLFDPLYTSSFIQLGMTATQAHELVHMWLGNIVTCRWWDDTWLNEGFARYFQHYGLHHVHRTWDTEEIFIHKVYSRVLLTDSVGYLPAVSHPVYTDTDASSIFSSITYDKGATIIRMMQRFLGEETFHDAIRGYVKKFAYSTASTNDLLEIMSKYAERDDSDLGGSNISDIMLPWLKQMGYPLVTITSNTGSSSFHVNQSIFLHNPMKPIDDYYGTNYSYVWNIPLTYQTSQNESTQLVWFHRNNGTITRPDIWAGSDWILANIDRAGFYRVNYDKKNWAALRAQLLKDHKIIPYINRGQLIDDAFSLTRSGQLDVVTSMSLTEYMTKETRYLPFFALMENFMPLNKLFYRSEIYESLRAYMRRILIPIYNKVRWDKRRTDVLSDLYLRSLILKMACEFGHGPCAEEARKRFKVFKRNPTDKTKIHPDIRQIVYCYGLRYGSEEDWEFFLEHYSKEDNIAERWMMRTSISCTANPWQLIKLLYMIAESNSSTNPIPIDDRESLWYEILKNPAVLPYIWRHLEVDIQSDKRYRERYSIISSMLDALSHYITSRVELKMMEDTYNKVYGYKGSGQWRNTAERNIEIYNANYNNVKMWLAGMDLKI